MKVELVKRQDRYDLYGVDGAKIASSAPNPFGKLSKENCDEIFGVIDVDDLASYFAYNQSPEDSQEDFAKFAFTEGFNKAMELNDKLFTVEDIRKAIEMARKGSMQEQHNGYGQRTSPIFVSDNLSVDTIIQSLQQPTEIEIEIEMDICGDKVYAVPEPKLDKNGCLMLRRI